MKGCNMNRITKIAVFTNSVLALLFVYSFFWLWGLVRSTESYLATSSWGLFFVSVRHDWYNGSEAVLFYPNYPFWIFIVLVFVNVIFVLMWRKKQLSHRVSNMR